VTKKLARVILFASVTVIATIVLINLDGVIGGNL